MRLASACAQKTVDHMAERLARAVVDLGLELPEIGRGGSGGCGLDEHRTQHARHLVRALASTVADARDGIGCGKGVARADGSREGGARRGDELSPTARG